MQVSAHDLGSPSLKSFVSAVVRIDVDRNQNAPLFENEPYSTTVNFNVPPGTSVYLVQAKDDDQTVRIFIFLGQ